MSNLKAKEYKSFEAIKHLSDDGNKFWYARELAMVLEYIQWRNFVKVLDRAKLSCKNSGYATTDHFAYATFQNAGYMGLYPWAILILNPDKKLLSCFSDPV